MIETHRKQRDLVMLTRPVTQRVWNLRPSWNIMYLVRYRYLLKIFNHKRYRNSDRALRIYFCLLDQYHKVWVRFFFVPKLIPREDKISIQIENAATAYVLINKRPKFFSAVTEVLDVLKACSLRRPRLLIIEDIINNRETNARNIPQFPQKSW